MKDRFLIDDFRSYLNEAQSLDEIFILLKKQVQKIGFEHFTYLALRPPQSPLLPLVLSTYPKVWTDRYAEKDYVTYDPIAAKIFNSVVPFEWSEVDKRTKIEKQIFGEASEVGLITGATVPLHGPNTAVVALSVCSSDSEGRFKKLWHDKQYVLHLSAQYAHEAITKMALLDNIEPSSVNLSDREKQCLIWASRGKTRWETAQIIGIAEETVKEYLETACQKLGTNSKQLAVVKAILLGILIPETRHLLKT